jgi:guanine deaminase
MTTSQPPAIEDLLDQAVELAVGNVDRGRAPFAAFVTLDGTVVGTGVNTERDDGDPTAHAEVAAIRDACRRLGVLELPGAIVVSSCEPCAMCQAVCAAVQVSEVVYAAPKELVPGIEEMRPALAQMQATLRELAGDSIRYVPTPGADRPFTKHVERMGGQK